MKHTFVFILKTLQLCLVAAVVFVSPAATIALMSWNKSFYTELLHSSSYCAVMTIITIFMVIAFVDSKPNKSKDNANNSK